MHRARLALTGLSVGDALGQTCFRDHNYEAILEDPRATARGPWPFTDDTEMAISVYDVLNEHGRIDQDRLAQRFAARYKAQPWRGYGGGAHRLLEQVGNGYPWRAVAEGVFPGGSFGNGSAMRIAPLAAYFADGDYSVVAKQARLSAEVTHAHPEGIAGAIATAVAGACVWRNRARPTEEATRRELFDAALAHTPTGLVRDGIERARTFTFDLSTESEVRLVGRGAAVVPFDLSIEPVVRALGNGSHISCQDTVPFCLWVAAMHLHNYQTALVQTIRARGDIDTNCAIVGGIVALAVGEKGIPNDWLAQREELVV
nr:ADP-ribosylglycohydrolase family protein [Gemmata palustris]